MKSEGKRLTLLEKEDKESKAKIKELEDKLQKAIADKSLYTRAKEKVSDTFSWFMEPKNQPMNQMLQKRNSLNINSDKKRFRAKKKNSLDK